MAAILVAVEKWGDRAIDALLAALLLVITLLTLAQVLWRYVIGTSFTWSEELNLLLWAWMIGLAAIKARHLRISMLVSAMPAKVQMVLYTLRWILTLAILGVLFVYGLSMVELTSSDRYVELDFLSRMWLFMSVPVAVVPWAVVATARYFGAMSILSRGGDPMDGR